MTPTQPRLNVRAAAEMLGKPIEKRLSELRKQKYPIEGNGKFAVPYYGPVKRAMRLYFNDGPIRLTEARAKIQSFVQVTKRANSERVLASFEQSDFAKRPLKPISVPRITALIEGVSVKLSPDLLAIEDGQKHYFYLNCCKGEYQPETARRVLELAHVVLTYNGVEVSPNQLHFIDLFAGKTYDINHVREGTILVLKQDAVGISKVWADL